MKRKSYGLFSMTILIALFMTANYSNAQPTPIWARGPIQLRVLPDQPANPQAQETVNGADNQAPPVNDMTGKYRIGIITAPVEPVLRAHLDIPEDGGLVIAEILPDSPAKDAGLEQYDIILSVDGKPIRSDEDLRDRVEQSQGTKLKVELLRKGRWQARELKPQPVRNANSNAKQLQIKVGDKTLSFPPDTEYSVVAKAVQQEMERQKIAARTGQTPQANSQSSTSPISVTVERRPGKSSVIRVTYEGQTYVTTEDQLDLLPDTIREPVRKALGNPAQVPQGRMMSGPHGAYPGATYPGAAHQRPHSGEGQGNSLDEMDETDWARFGAGLLRDLMQSPPQGH